MNLTELTYFNEVANTSHFTRASEKLNVSQPALSRTIKHLEKELKVPLFVKKGRNVTLSRYGEALFKHSQLILNEIESITTEINDLKEITNNTVSILVNSASSQMRRLLVDFQKANKNVNLSVTQLDKTEYKDKKNEFDLIIHSDTHFNSATNQKDLLEEHLMLSIPKNHKLAKKSSVDLKDIANENLISLSENKDLREINDYYCELAGFKPKFCFENNSPYVIKEYIKTGLGFAIIPSISWKEVKSNDKIKLVNIHNPNCKRYIILEWKKVGYMSKVTTLLKNYIIKNFRKYL
ncbi:MAG: LysR family transcriptional regulator [Lachnospiraceae bacterium]|nr:LysR family transcriptional regulator [Lachnospiraceae bacterium]